MAGSVTLLLLVALVAASSTRSSCAHWRSAVHEPRSARTLGGVVAEAARELVGRTAAVSRTSSLPASVVIAPAPAPTMVPASPGLRRSVLSPRPALTDLPPPIAC